MREKSIKIALPVEIFSHKTYCSHNLHNITQNAKKKNL